MKISNYAVEQGAFSKFVHQEKQITKVELSAPKAAMLRALNKQDRLELNHSNETQEIDDMAYLSEEDRAKITLLEKFITALTGKEFKFTRIVKLNKDVKQQGYEPQASQPQANPSIGIRFSSSHEVYESEKMAFSSKGEIKTEDGRTINFELNLSYSRSYYEKRETAFQIGGATQDPLVINLDGQGIAFGSDSIKLDLNLDGNEDTFRRLAGGSGFLALDLNQNGIVDDGNELFGPKTGQGFEELGAYDADKNGWIDENDEIFDSLKIWQVDENGNSTLLGLKETGVGAIYLGAVTSPYHIKEGLDTIADIKKSSIYLNEDGRSAVIHEIDLKI